MSTLYLQWIVSKVSFIIIITRWQMPIHHYTGSAETWQEATASEADMPEWGPEEERGIDMEVMTAAADLAAGSDAVILRHPEAVATISRMIKALA